MQQAPTSTQTVSVGSAGSMGSVGSVGSVGSLSSVSSIGSAGGAKRLGRRVRALAVAVVEDEGSATAEYAVATMAAVGFAGLLVVILRGDEVRGILTDLVRRALTSQG